MRVPLLFERTTVKWEDPPGVGRNPKTRHLVWQAEARELKDNPGKWGVIAEYEAADPAEYDFKEANRLKNYVSGINHAKWPAFEPAGSFEATSRKIGNGIKVYARYIGEK